MKRLSHRVLIAAMSMLMLLSSSGLQAQLHFCDGQFVSFSLFGNIDECQNCEKCNIDISSNVSCTEGSSMMCCASMENDHNSIEECQKNCCSDRVVQIQSLTEGILFADVSTDSEKRVEIVLSNDVRTIRNLQSAKHNKLRLKHPPPLQKNFQVLLQSFRL